MDPYIGEIRLFAGTYAPQDWLLCNGQLLNVNEYQALYAVIGNEFGGTAPSTFKLPDLTGKAPLHRGQGAGLTAHNFASTGGTATETLTTSQIPAHQHIPQSLNVADGADPNAKMWANSPRTVSVSAYTPTPNVQFSPLAISAAGGGNAHNNMQPFVGIIHIICWNGVYPDFNN
ncbi:phage tail protein [Paenibacillus hunanensis]|uniref:Microcystin-dependent protein n=1 Tax=Paenibacillus hunanensis TaxID=539262 RepID=A0ABU1J2Y3_9BACL|nr:tail fiber protein [Paenibacillus hunanensis]MDR6245867.1 microcystin-dependent protein [Paenibacillus hunanensis]GGJ14106.1 tail protein [Paenibacillus hunanensis]